MYRDLIALSLAVTVTAPCVGAQSLTRAGVALGRANIRTAVWPGDRHMMSGPATPVVARDSERLPPPPSHRSSLAKFIMLGASFGMLAGGIYGIREAINCKECFPGTQVLFIPYGMMGGGVIGAGLGGVGWVVSRPFVGRGSHRQ